MNNNYADIRDRIPEAPKWWDEHAGQQLLTKENDDG